MCVVSSFDLKSHIHHAQIQNMQINQDDDTSLIWAAFNGHLPMVEYLVERGGDLEAKNKVNDVMVEMIPHTRQLCINLLDVSVRKQFIDTSCNPRSFASG